MPKRKRQSKARASKTAPVLLLLALFVLAFGVGCSLLQPRHQARTHAAHHIAPAATTTQAVEAQVTAAPAAVETATPATVEATETPAETTSPVPTESPVVNPNGPKVALIVDDCGQWIDTERGFVALPIPVTLSVLPDVRYTSTIAQEAAGAGKGVMLHLPMETVSGMNPGPGKVTTEMTDAQISAQVADDLAQVPLAEGVNNHEGSKASADERVMRDVAAVIAQHGNLFFVDSRTASNSVAQQAAEDAGLATASRDVFLDNKADVAYTEEQLREAIAIAKRTGSAIAIGHPRPTTLEAVRALIPEFQREGVSFVLARDLTKR